MKNSEMRQERGLGAAGMLPSSGCRGFTRPHVIQAKQQAVFSRSDHNRGQTEAW